MSDTSKVFDAKKIVTTLASLNNQNAKFFGIPVEYPEKSTLNEHLKFLQNILPGNDVYPNACYMCIGDRGHMLTVDSEGDGVAVPIKHDPTDAAPYRIRPFVMRPIDDDLSDEAREKWELEYAAAQARWESHKAAVIKSQEAEAAIGEITDVAGSSFTSESTGAGTLADDEALAALREKLSGGNA